MVMMVMVIVVNVDTTVIRDRRAWLDMRPGQCLNGVAPKYGGEGDGGRFGEGRPNNLITQIAAGSFYIHGKSR